MLIHISVMLRGSTKGVADGVRGSIAAGPEAGHLPAALPSDNGTATLRSSSKRERPFSPIGREHLVPAGATGTVRPVAADRVGAPARVDAVSPGPAAQLVRSVVSNEDVVRRTGHDVLDLGHAHPSLHRPR